MELCHFTNYANSPHVRQFVLLKVFFYIGTVLSLIGIYPVVRFLYFYFTVGGEGHLQSLVLGGVLLIMGFLSYLVGLVADLISFNRQLLEMILEKTKLSELEKDK